MMKQMFIKASVLTALAMFSNAGFTQAGDAGSITISEPSVLGLVAAGVIASILLYRRR